MPDKTNIDVRMGHPLAVRQNEEVYTTLYIANFILGGNFSSRLMDIVRDEMGLTYGVNASLTGINRHYDGYWLVNITLSEDKLEEGLEATKNVLADFVAQGATADELADKKTTLTGTFKVQLATTNGLAATILRGLERGFGRDYLDRFPEWIEATTLEEINGAVKAHFDPGSLHTALAGSIPENITIQG
jgi:predicted Zn-dependent peptidase